MKKCKDCRFFRMRYDEDTFNEFETTGIVPDFDKAVIPYCTESESDVNPEDTPECWQEYRNID